jgi:hypothetical protein
MYGAFLGFVVLLFSSLWSAGVALSLSLFFSAGYAYAI